MSKQTAVEWLYELSKERELDKFDLEQAKAMEKQQIIDAHGELYDYSYSQIDPTKVTGEQYYNETFGGNK
jgi:hypothetical protein